MHMMAGRMAAIQDNYSRGMGGAAPPRLLSEASRATLHKVPGGDALIALDDSHSGPPATGPAPSTAPVAPQTHTFSLGAWQKSNPQGDANAAKSQAQAQGFQVVQ
jgi:hypothetical protein